MSMLSMMIVPDVSSSMRRRVEISEDFPLRCISVLEMGCGVGNYLPACSSAYGYFVASLECDVDVFEHWLRLPIAC